MRMSSLPEKQEFEPQDTVEKRLVRRSDPLMAISKGILKSVEKVMGGMEWTISKGLNFLGKGARRVLKDAQYRGWIKRSSKSALDITKVIYPIDPDKLKENLNGDRVLAEVFLDEIDFVGSSTDVSMFDQLRLPVQTLFNSGVPLDQVVALFNDDEVVELMLRRTFQSQTVERQSNHAGKAIVLLLSSIRKKLRDFIDEMPKLDTEDIDQQLKVVVSEFAQDYDPKDPELSIYRFFERLRNGFPNFQIKKWLELNMDLFEDVLTGNGGGKCHLTDVVSENYYENAKHQPMKYVKANFKGFDVDKDRGFVLNIACLKDFFNNDIAKIRNGNSYSEFRGMIKNYIECRVEGVDFSKKMKFTLEGVDKEDLAKNDLRETYGVDSLVLLTEIVEDVLSVFSPEEASDYIFGFEEFANSSPLLHRLYNDFFTKDEEKGGFTFNYDEYFKYLLGFVLPSVDKSKPIPMDKALENSRNNFERVDEILKMIFDSRITGFEMPPFIQSVIGINDLYKLIFIHENHPCPKVKYAARMKVLIHFNQDTIDKESSVFLQETIHKGLMPAVRQFGFSIEKNNFSEYDRFYEQLTVKYGKEQLLVMIDGYLNEEKDYPEIGKLFEFYYNRERKVPGPVKVYYKIENGEIIHSYLPGDGFEDFLVLYPVDCHFEDGDKKEYFVHYNPEKGNVFDLKSVVVTLLKSLRKKQRFASISVIDDRYRTKKVFKDRETMIKVMQEDRKHMTVRSIDYSYDFLEPHFNRNDLEVNTSTNPKFKNAVIKGDICVTGHGNVPVEIQYMLVEDFVASESPVHEAGHQNYNKTRIMKVVKAMLNRRVVPEYWRTVAKTPAQNIYMPEEAVSKREFKSPEEIEAIEEPLFNLNRWLRDNGCGIEPGNGEKALRFGKRLIKC